MYFANVIVTNIRENLPKNKELSYFLLTIILYIEPQIVKYA